MKCKYEGSGVWKDRCVGTKEVDPCIGYEKCERYRPNCKTNADHIRSMTDEELAEFIYYHKQEACSCCELTETDGSCTETLCENATLRWLKQPFDGGDT